MGAVLYVIGLTGNIATGKSTVCAMLRSLGAEWLDADHLAHWVMRAGTATHQRIVDRFGCQVLGLDGEVDSARLGPIVFADPDALADLESLVHPAVVDETLRRLSQSHSDVFVVEAVKLLEANMHRYCDAVWVVTAPPQQQIERLMSTRHLSRAAAELRLSAQPRAESRIAQADVVIDNGGTLAQTWHQVLEAWNAIPGVVPVSFELPWPTARPEG